MLKIRTVSGLLLLGLVLLFISCGTESSSSGTQSSSGKDSSSSPSSPEKAVYLIFSSLGYTSATQDNLFSVLEKEEVTFTPWIDQIRPAGFFAAEGNIFFAVNRIGIGRIISDETGFTVKYPEENDFFADRTLGGFVLEQNSLFCQLFAERIFSSDSPLGRVPLVEFLPSEGTYREAVLSIPTGDQRGELVEAFFGENEWLFSWKRTDAGKVSFIRERRDPQLSEVQVISDEEYMKKLCPKSIEEAPVFLKKLFLKFKSESIDDGKVYILESSSGGPAESWHSGDMGLLSEGKADLVILKYLGSGKGGYLLDLNGRQLWSESAPLPEELPFLPTGCLYTDFYIKDDLLILSWEQRKFPMVGASGLVLIDRD